MRRYLSMFQAVQTVLIYSDSFSKGRSQFHAHAAENIVTSGDSDQGGQAASN